MDGVSTHSRPKAAGDLIKFATGFFVLFQLTAARRRLARFFLLYDFGIGFNSQPPEGGWLPRFNCATSKTCFNSQPPEGGWLPVAHKLNQGHLFQLTAARRRLELNRRHLIALEAFQLTAARRRLARAIKNPILQVLFQLTAARRRLVSDGLRRGGRETVSTHSRPKAAGSSGVATITRQ